MHTDGYAAGDPLLFAKEEMMRWTPSEIARVVGGKFSPADPDEPAAYREISFDIGGMRYSLSLCPDKEFVWFRADVENPDQATPHFEFSFRCDRVRVGPGGYDSEAVRFDFSDGEEDVDYVRHTRLVIDRLPNGNLYVWPMIGMADPPFEDD